MSREVVLEVAGLSKRYCHDLRRSLVHGVADIARELWPRRGPAALRRGEFMALDDVSFDLRRGDALVVLGDNGAGKSTLLRTLLGILKPDAGEIRVRGRMEAIMDLGAGLHETLSGRENLRLRAAMHALSPAAARAVIDGAIAFADLGSFIDDAVQTYSTGMKARLAFAAAAQLRPDILLVDEALAVGDLAFQRKCIAHMRAFTAGGGALILVSHNSHQVQATCRRGLLLERGRVVLTGTAAEALSAMFERRSASESRSSAPVRTGPVGIDRVTVSGTDGIDTGAPVDVVLAYRADAPIRARWGFRIWTDDHDTCVTGGMSPALPLAAGNGTLRCRMPRLPLVAGRYRLDATLIDADTLYELARFGYTDGGVVVRVRARPDPLVHLRIKSGQLIETDVEWDEVAS